MEKENSQNNPENTNEHQLFLQTKDEQVRNNEKMSIPRAEERYYNVAIKTDHPLTSKATPRIYPKTQR
jgi:hypothetical protein